MYIYNSAINASVSDTENQKPSTELLSFFSSMASSIPQFYTDYSISSTDFSQFPFPPPVTGENSGVSTSSGGTICSSNGNCGGGGGGAMWVSEENNYLPATFGNSLLLPRESGAAPVMCSFPEQIGGPEPVVSGTFMPEFNMGFSGVNDICCSGVQDFGATYGDQQQQQIPNVVNVCEYGDECCGFMQEFNKPMYPGENWVSIIIIIASSPSSSQHHHHSCHHHIIMYHITMKPSN